MKSLWESKGFLDMVMDTIQDGISILDADLNIIRVNHSLEEWYPHMMPLQGKKCYFAYHGRSEPCEICPSKRAIDRKAVQSDVVPFQGKNSELLGWQEIYAFPIKDDRDEVYGVIEHVRDITGRKHIEEALWDSEEKYRELVESANSIIIRWDLQGNFTFFNEFSEQFFGYSKSEIIGKSVIGTIVPARDTSGRDLIAMISDIIQHSERYASNANENMRKNGERVWISWTNRPIRDKHGNVIEILSVGNDITERKHIEDALYDAKAQAELYLDLMGHDINNMNQIALGYLELANDKDNAADHREFLDKSIEALQRSTWLIKNVRKLQKLKQGDLQAGLVDVCPVLADVQREYETLPDKAVTLNMNGHEHCQVRANELLYDMFANLVSNANKHTGNDTETIVDLNVINVNGGRYCRVMVEDNGPGIPDDLKDTIFNRLQRGTTKAKGMGLGLYLVKSLADSYGGQVWVEDRVPGDHSKGARFVVMLPVEGK